MTDYITASFFGQALLSLTEFPFDGATFAAALDAVLVKDTIEPVSWNGRATTNSDVSRFDKCVMNILIVDSGNGVFEGRAQVEVTDGYFMTLVGLDEKLPFALLPYRYQ